MKICVISQQDIRNPKTWSGTVLTLVNKFEEHEMTVEGFEYDKFLRHTIQGKLKSLYNRIFFTWGTMRDGEFGWYKRNAKCFHKLLKGYNADAYIFMGEHCLDNQISESSYCYVYIDRAIMPMIDYQNVNNKPGVKRFIKKYKCNDLKSLNQMKMIFTQNDWTRNYLVSEYGINKSKILNIGFGINVKPFYGEKNYSNHKILIVLRKGVEKVKGLDLLMNAFKEVRKVIKDMTLHVVGTDGEAIEGVYYYYDKGREVTVRLFQECTLYAMPARTEPNGITYLEALANRTPILGTNRFAFPEFSGYGKYGFICDSCDISSISEQLINAFSDVKRLDQMGKLGQEYVIRRFSWEEVSGKMIDVIKDDYNEKQKNV